MKYIIDIDDEPLCDFGKETQTYFPRVWKAKGFNSLVFDKNGLSKLTPLDRHDEKIKKESYQEGKIAGVAQPTLYGYNIKHLELIARVLQKEDLPPERLVEILTDIGRIVAIVKDEFEETLRKAVEQCTI